MRKTKIIFLFLIILVISPFLRYNPPVMDPYGYSSLILTKAINTNGVIDFHGFTLGDHWRGHAQNMLGDVRSLTSILIAMISQITSIDPLNLANIPLFSLLIPIIAFLFLHRKLTLNQTSSSGYILLLFFITAISLLQPSGINYLSYGFFLTFLLLYIGVRWIKHESSIDAILTIVVFIAASRTYYTAYISSAMFLFGMLLYTAIFFRERRRYWSFTLVGVVFLFIVLWFDNILQATIRTVSFENINLAINSILMFKPATPQIFNPYIDMVPTNPYLAISHSVIRVILGFMGAYALLMCLKNRTFRRDLPIVTGLLFMSLFETLSYILIGGVFLVRLLYSICLPFVIVLWAGNFLKNNVKYKKASALILVILCGLSAIIVLKNYEDNADRQIIVKNVEMIDSVTYDASAFFKNNMSYMMIAGSTESAFLSYKTFEPQYNALAEFGPFLPIMDNDLASFLAKINSSKQDLKIVFMPHSYPYIEIYAWSDIYLLKNELYEEIAKKLNIIYDGPFIVYETHQS